MKNITKKARNFFKALHEDETGPGTVEWVLMIIVALIIMAVIYYIAQWVIQGGTDEATEVNTRREKATEDAKAVKDALGVK